jgi:curved DNA-binding protein CbpA
VRLRVDRDDGKHYPIGGGGLGQMSALPDYCAVLGVSPASDDVVIRAAFRALMLKYHPDTNKAAGATKRAEEINAAWAVLSDQAKRAAYDQQWAKARESKSTSQSSGSGAPPPPPPREQDIGRSKGGADGFLKRHAKAVGGWLAAALIIGLVRVVVMSSTHQSVTTTAAENPADNAAAIIDVNPVPESATSNSASSSAFGMGLANSDAPLIPTNLSPSPVSYDDIEAAASKFDKILQKSGIVGARAYSEACHKAVQNKPSWPNADGCAAFDYAASFVDEGVSRSMGVDSEGYFAFEKDNQSDNYRVFGSFLPDLGNRLQTIQKTADRAVYDVIEARIASSRSRNENATDNAAVEENTAPP